MSGKVKMISGEPYDPANPQLVLERDRANRIYTRYNKKPFHEINMRNRMMRKLLNTSGNFWVKPPFYCDYGYNIMLGKDVMLNYGCVLLDVCPITIKDKTLIGPNVQIYTACHAVNPQERINGVEYGKPVTIGKNVWIGGGSIICPGVEIGDNTVIGAGSVVIKNIPPNVMACGNPCVVKKKLSQKEIISTDIEIDR